MHRMLMSCVLLWVAHSSDSVVVDEICLLRSVVHKMDMLNTNAELRKRSK